MNIKRKEKELLEQIKELRQEHGFSQRGLCAIINMQQPSLVKVENARISPQLDTLLKILEPLGYTIDFVKIKEPEKD